VSMQSVPQTSGASIAFQLILNRAALVGRFVDCRTAIGRAGTQAEGGPIRIFDSAVSVPDVGGARSRRENARLGATSAVVRA